MYISDEIDYSFLSESKPFSYPLNGDYFLLRKMGIGYLRNH